LRTREFWNQNLLVQSQGAGRIAAFQPFHKILSILQIWIKLSLASRTYSSVQFYREGAQQLNRQGEEIKDSGKIYGHEKDMRQPL
jgi:hypothetical protein